MPAEIRTPFSKTPAVKGQGGMWRKRVLPIGEVEYKGRMLKFDRDYLNTLAAAFNSGAYDQVPFQLAPDDNKHTNNPERTRGWVTGMTVQDDGLWVTAEVTPEGNQVLSANPRLGVSARIVEDYARSDGQYYPAAIQHVLGTLDPRIPGLGAWEAVEMSNGPGIPDMVIDLSAATFAGEEGGGIMPDLNPEQQGKLARLLELDPDQLSALVGSMATEPDDPQDESDDELIAAINSMSDEDFEAVAAEFDIEDEPVLAGAGAGAALSNGYGMGDIELANYQLAEQARQMAVLQGQHDKQAYENEKRTLASKHNVPPWITELARPLLEGTGRTVELSNGGMVDAGLVMRRVLQAFGGVVNGLGLEAPVELGTSIDEPDTSASAAQDRAERVSAIRGQLGI